MRVLGLVVNEGVVAGCQFECGGWLSMRVWGLIIVDEGVVAACQQRCSGLLSMKV